DHGQPTQYDPLIRVFPRMTKCLFHKFGFSGSIEKHDALCFLPLNIVNEQHYVVLWFWFTFLLIFTSISILFSIARVFSHGLRYRTLINRCPSARRRFLRRLTDRCGTWFILSALADNMKPSFFAAILETLVREHYDSD